MLKRHSQLFRFGVFVADMGTAAVAWCGAYSLRFESGLFFVHPKEVPDTAAYLRATPWVLLICWICYSWCRLYEPRREGALFEEIRDIGFGTLLTVVVLAAATFFYRRDGFSYSRKFALIFAVLNGVLLIAERCGIRLVLRRARKRGWNLRYVLVAGAGRLGQMLVDRVHQNTWTGLSVVGYVDDSDEHQGRSYHNVPVLGQLADLPRILHEHSIDQLFCALPFDEHAKIKDVTDLVANEMVDLRIVPDYVDFLTMHSHVGEFDGLPVVSLRESPLHGWNRVLKRAIDIVGALLALAVFGIPMAIIALLIRKTSPGPVFYRQERTGLDGQDFEMLKFRSMRVDAEAQTGAVWASKDDPRRTPIGTFLRRWSLDEFPQLFNVLRGEMSLVGPRPERPEFIEEFRKTVPKYMLRHKMKAGMTGWAQINGWRGNTSLEKRIQYDLHYIEDWSILFDLWILLLTPLKGFRSGE